MGDRAHNGNIHGRGEKPPPPPRTQVKPYNQKTAGKVVGDRGSGNTVSQCRRVAYAEPPVKVSCPSSVKVILFGYFSLDFYVPIVGRFLILPTAELCARINYYSAGPPYGCSPIMPISSSCPQTLETSNNYC